MTKLVALKLDGDLQQGVRVTLSIANEGVSPHKEVTGNLPAVVSLQTTIDQWRSHYRSLGSDNRGIKAIKVTYDASITQNYENCQKSAKELQTQLNNWLRSESFRPIRESWLKELPEQELVRVLIRTSSQQLRQIPWHLWDLVEEYPNAEIALSATDYQKAITTKTPTKRDKVKILAILGNSTGIDVETDRRLLNSLPDADVTFLVQPQRHEISDSLWEKSWDILFFAGHSQTIGDSGRIYINENQESLTIDDLKYGLKKAKSNGLAVAIFNSCDGLGLASDLEALQIPQIIVMGEQVPDKVAQVFLKHFLENFAAAGKSLYQAAKEARLKLHGLEDQYPCASWLPVICQNAGTAPPSWLDLGRRPTDIIPYRGLFAFKEEHAQFFFGRESFTDILIAAVQNQPLVAVIGASGSGKSSLVFAGLVKRLRDTGNWDIVDFRPGSKPLFNLANALFSHKLTDFNADARQKGSPPPVLSRTECLQEIRKLASHLAECENKLRDVVDDLLQQDPNQHLLLIADQFEELYTLCTDAQERQAFLDRLLEAIKNRPNFTFVLTLRADFLGQALSYRPFADALQYADLKLSPMTNSELQAAIEKPASLLGVRIEDGLAERIISEVSAEPGDLPLLEFALTQLWAKQLDAQLTHPAYDEIGKVEAALARYADQVYNQLCFEDKERAQRIFIQLVHPGEGTEDTRRLAIRAEVGEENWDLVTRLADARLVVTGWDEKTGLETVEIVHEALIRSWEKLHQWMQQDRNFRQWQELLRIAMRTWESSGFDEGALLRGKPLTDAEDWQQKRPHQLSKSEQNFILESLALKDREKQERERQRRRAMIGLTGFSAVASILAGAAALGWSFTEFQRQQTINGLTTASQELFDSNKEFDALLTSINASKQLKQSAFGIHSEMQFQVKVALQQAIYGVKERNRLEGHNSGVFSVTFSPDGRMLASGSRDSTIKLWETGTGKEIRTLTGHKDTVSVVSFSPDGQLLVSASNSDKTVKLWDVSTGKNIFTWNGYQADGNGNKGVSFSPDGRSLAVASINNTIQLWDVATRQQIATFTGHSGTVNGVSFSPDGRLLASASFDRTVKLWDVATHKEISTLTGHNAWVFGVSFSPDGRILASGADGGGVKLWDIATRKEISHLSGFSGRVTNLSFSRDGQQLIASGFNNAIKIWNVATRQEISTLTGHRNNVNSVSYSPDGQWLASASSDYSIKLWYIAQRQEIKTLYGGNVNVSSVSFSPDGRLLAATSKEYNRVKLWDVATDKEIPNNIQHSDWIESISFSPDGKKLVSGSWDNTVKLWNVATGKEIPSNMRHNLWVTSASFSPDGRRLASASWDNTVKLWDVATGKELYTLTGHSSVVFSPDGKILASASSDQTIKLWDVATGKELATLTGSKTEGGSVSFSPDGQMLAFGGDKTIVLWDVATRKKIATLTGHKSEINSVSFSPDGRSLASGSKDNNIILWDIATRKQINIFNPRSEIYSLSFSPDGRQLASGTASGRVILWNLEKSNSTLEDLLAQGCNWLHSYLENNPNVSNSDKQLCNGIDDTK
ncbi:WD-repeat protein [Calothrix sp. NIES-2100]|uniref:nSTAND1 domain-containing NTPase n=1 Tax=Calothrix sp. NIES-2100 TaxID=1954172 RepID=UPI000B61BF9F|nr:WD-repeat protein [Calothrix sp. NIES-2100]